MEMPITGGLVGWKRTDAAHGCVLVFKSRQSEANSTMARLSKSLLSLMTGSCDHSRRTFKGRQRKENCSYGRPNLLQRLFRLPPKLPKRNLANIE